MKGPGLVIGIDVGWANLGTCSIGSDWKTPVRWTNQRIMNGAYKEDILWQATVNWCEENAKEFDAAELIVLERQHEPPLRMMNTTIRTMYPYKTRIVSPKTIAAHFKLAHVRKQKKQDAVKLVAKNLRIPDGKKQDDMADAFLLAIWGCQQLERKLEGFKI